MKLSKTLTALAALVVTLGSGAAARAESYAFATQSLSNFSFSGATIGTLEFETLNSALISGGIPSGGDAQLGEADALQAYVGPLPRPPENTFTAVGLTNADYARGDALITSAPTPFATANVAETYLTTLPSNSGSSGIWGVSSTITLAQDGTVTLGFDYTNALEVLVTEPGGTASSSFAFNFTIAELNTGVILFSSSPTAVNAGLSLTGIGALSDSSSGTVSITSTTLAAGTYAATITGTERAFASIVPEPSSIALSGVGLVGLVGLAARRRAIRRR